MNEAQPFYRFRCEATGEPSSAELLIFAAIGDWEDMGEVSAQAFARDLSKLPTSVKRLDIHINSPGGSLSEAQAIYSRLADHRSDKHVYIDGLAASAASIVAMVGHKIFIRANANMMIHLPSALAIGNADDFRGVIAALESMTESMINVYAKRTKIDRTELRALLAAETWFSAQQAVEKGFADELRGVVKAAAMIDEKHAIFNGLEFDLSRFHNVPAFTATENKPKGTTQMKPKAQTAAEETPPKEGDDKEKKGNGEEGKETPPATPQTPPTPPEPPKTGEPSSDTAAKAVQAERARVAALLELDRPATHSIVQAAIKDGKQVTDVIKDVMAAMDRAGTQNARRADAHQLDGIAPSGEEGDKSTFGSLVKNKVQSRMKQKRVRGFSRN